MPAVIPLKRRWLSRNQWRLEVDDDNENLTVITPAISEPWVIPLVSVSGVCDLPAHAPSHDDLALAREAHVLWMYTRGSNSACNLVVVLNPPQSPPHVSYRNRRGLGIGRGDMPNGTAPLDGFAVEARDPGNAAGFLAAVGVERFPTQRAALIDAVGAVPISKLSEPEQRRVRRTNRLSRILPWLFIAMFASSLVARFAVQDSPVSLWGWITVAVTAVLFVASFGLLSYVRRQERHSIATDRLQTSKAFGLPDD